jgi:PAS domain S-box-containing protein
MKQRLRAFAPRPTTIGLMLIVLLIVLNLCVSEWNIQRLIENEHRVVHTQEVLTILEEVLSRVTEAETSERGFLITGDETYLQSYERAIVRAREALQQLARLTVDHPRQPAQVVALQDRVEARFDELRRAIAAQRSGGFDAARHSVSTNHGRRLMNEMRGLVGQMQTQEREALAARSAQSRRSARITTVTDLIGALLGIGMVGLCLLLFRREMGLRQRADEAARRLAAIVESSDDSIISKSLDGLIVSWNAGAQRVYGYAPEEVIGRSVAMLCPPERVDEVEQQLKRVRNGEHIEHFETTRVRKDGRRIDVSLSISPIKDAAGNVVGASAIGRDITDQKVLQREVLEIAARQQREIGQDLHDDTGQELTGLAMMAQRLAGELAARSLPQVVTATRIVDGLEQALNHVRALSKGLVPVEVDAEGLMVSLADLAARTSEMHAIACSFRCDEPVCIVDNQAATHLYRLSQEAVTNAVKHGRARNIVITLKADHDLVTLDITDDGYGFKETNRTDGTGLRIMRYRADLIGAKLRIRSIQPRGTAVTCTLPQRQERQPLDARPAEACAPLLDGSQPG